MQSFVLRASTLLISALFVTGGLPEKDQIQVKPEGSLAQVEVRDHREAGLKDLFDLEEEAHEHIEHSREIQKLMRAELGKIRKEAMGILVESTSSQRKEEANCSAAAGLDPLSNNFCAILDGDNWQVAGKLERTVKRMHSLASGVGRDIEEDSLIQTLQGALWELWFCAKRVTPVCKPENTTEEKYRTARHDAWAALSALQRRAGVAPTSPPRPMVGIPAAVNLEMSARRSYKAPATSWPVPGSSNKHVAWTKPISPGEALLEAAGQAAEWFYFGQEDAAASHLKTTNATEWAITTLDGLVTAPNATGKLWDAIHSVDYVDTLEKSLVTVKEDEEGNMRKMKDNLLILHECASMPDCPAENCCTPANPTQARFIQARDMAYQAFHNIREDDREGTLAYMEILKTVAESTTYYPVGHPLHTSTTPNLQSDEGAEKVEKETVVVEDDKSSKPLLIIICVVSGLVVVAVLILIVMTMGGVTGKWGKKKKADEEWGEEGYGEEQY